MIGAWKISKFPGVRTYSYVIITLHSSVRSANLNPRIYFPRAHHAHVVRNAISLWTFFLPRFCKGLITLSQTGAGGGGGADGADDFMPFDREKNDFHYLTVEARDEVGKGNRNTVELLIHLKDVNDNAPKFEQDSYETFLPENNDQFPSPFLVRADDKDENGTENAQIRWD